MARLMFVNKIERNDENSSKNIENNTNKTEMMQSKNTNEPSTTELTNGNIENIIIRDRCQLSNISMCNSTKKIADSNSKIAHLTSKFNVMNFKPENTNTNTNSSNSNNNNNNNNINKNNIDRIKCTNNKKLSSRKSFRSSAVQQTIQFFEKDLKINRTRSSDGCQLLFATECKVNGKNNSITKPEDLDKMLLIARNRLKPIKQQCNGTENKKPMLQPKPIVSNVSVTSDKKLQPSNITRLERSKTKNCWNEQSEPLAVLTNQRSSSSQSFTVECVPNSANNLATETDVATVTEVSAICYANDKSFSSTFNNNNKANNSFLHKYLEHCSENKIITNLAHSKTTVTAISANKPLSASDDTIKLSIIEEIDLPFVKNVKNSSSLHCNLIINNSLNLARNDSEYEDLHDTAKIVNGSVSSLFSDSSNADHHEYMDLNEIENERNSAYNIYDDVIYSQLYNKIDDDGSENYETISCDNYDSSTLSKESTNVRTYSSTVISTQSDSDESSLDQTNSLYDMKQNSSKFLPSDTSQSVISTPNDCININIQSPCVYITDFKSTNSGHSDDWIDIDYWDNEDKDFKEIIVYRKRPNLGRLRKFKKRKFRTATQKKEYKEVQLPQSQSNKNDGYFIDELCDDFDDSSSDFDSNEIDERIPPPPFNHRHKDPNTEQSSPQNFYGLVKKARKTVRKSWTSLNQIRKIGVGNISTSFPIRSQDVSRNRKSSISVVEENHEKNNTSSRSVENGGSVRWSSFKTKLRPRYSTISASSSSVFYVNPEDLCFNKTNDNKPNLTNNRRRRMTCVDLHPTPRPTSPPPPPPVNRNLRNAESKSNGTSLSSNNSNNSNIYSDRSTSSYESRNSISGPDVNSEINSSRGSDIQLRFADEPLYQFYAESVAQLTNSSLDCLSDSDGYEEIASTSSRPTAMELITPCANGHGQYRSLWCEVSEVKISGILGMLDIGQQRLQEAKFEVITSEASYYKSLTVLDKIFANNPMLRDETVLNKNDWKILFGNVAAVRKCSENLLAGLEQCWQESILLTGLCDVIYQHATEHFKIYVKYCSNQIYIDRTLKRLRDQNFKFIEIISQLESNPKCQSLTLHSFLMLPMQRITRMPLLIDAILSKLNPAEEDYKTYQITLGTLNKIVKDCNETARKLEQYEEMLLLSRQLEFSRKEVKMFSIASSSRWLIRSGPMWHINPPDAKLTFTRKLTKQTTKLYFFLFNDILIVAKKKSEDSFVVFDYCARNVMQMSLLDESNVLFPLNPSSPYRYLLMLTILENHESKTVEMILNCDSDSTRQRWIEATSSHLTSDNPDEKLYEEWDCPQVSAIHTYTAVEPDELSLQKGDVVKVLKKTNDGWCHGERIRDGVTGWFPGNYTIEIASQHTRAKNLKLRYRLLTLSASYLQLQQYNKKT